MDTMYSSSLSVSLSVTDPSFFSEALRPDNSGSEGLLLSKIKTLLISHHLFVINSVYSCLPL